MTMFLIGFIICELILLCGLMLNPRHDGLEILRKALGNLAYAWIMLMLPSVGMMASSGSTTWTPIICIGIAICHGILSCAVAALIDNKAAMMKSTRDRQPVLTK